MKIFEYSKEWIPFEEKRNQSKSRKLRRKFVYIDNYNWPRKYFQRMKIFKYSKEWKYSNVWKNEEQLIEYLFTSTNKLISIFYFAFFVIASFTIENIWIFERMKVFKYLKERRTINWIPIHIYKQTHFNFVLRILRYHFFYNWKYSNIWKNERRLFDEKRNESKSYRSPSAQGGKVVSRNR